MPLIGLSESMAKPNVVKRPRNRFRRCEIIAGLKMYKVVFLEEI
jgi:hypothetical protein